jgi:hypothetical protein
VYIDVPQPVTQPVAYQQPVVQQAWAAPVQTAAIAGYATAAPVANWGANWGAAATTAIPYATAAPVANWGTNWGTTGFNTLPYGFNTVGGFGGLNTGFGFNGLVGATVTATDAPAAAPAN